MYVNSASTRKSQIAKTTVALALITAISAATFAAAPASLAQRQVATYQREYPSAHLVFVGDVMVGRSVDAAMQKYGDDYPFAAISDTLRSADLAIGNLETTLTEQATPFRPDDKWINLKGRPATASALARAGFDVVTVANNHALDYGTSGLDDTVSALRANNLSVIGTNAQPSIAMVHGLRIAFLGYDCAATSQPAANTQLAQLACSGEQVAATKARLAADITKAHQQAETVIVFMHWGVEYSAAPADYQRELAQAMADAGANLIVGCHPHVAQGMTQLGQTPVVYSLGNFVFDQRVPSETMTGMMLDVIIKHDGVESATLRPVNTYIQAKLLQSDDSRALSTTAVAASSTDETMQWHAVAPLPPLPATVNPNTVPPVTPTLALSYQREEQASGWLGDLDGDGSTDWLSYSPSPNPAGSLSIYTAADAGLLPTESAWQWRMSTPVGMQVQQYFVVSNLAGSNAAPSIIINLWQPDFRWGGKGKLKNQLCVYTWWPQQHQWRDKWCGRPRPVVNYNISIVSDAKGSPRLAVLQGNDPAQATMTVWSWSGFGFAQDWQAAGTGYTHLAADPAAHRFLYR